MDYALPPRLRNASGAVRRVGIEVELGGLDVGDAAALVARTCGGTVQAQDHVSIEIASPHWGTFRVELDSSPLRKRPWLEPLRRIGVDEESETAQWVERSVVGVASLVVPVEVITPPIPIDELAELEPLWAALHDAGAESSDASLLYAFSLQLNPEPPVLAPASVMQHLQAYFLLEGWLLEHATSDLSRRVLPYVHPFPAEFVRAVIGDALPQSWDELVQRYVTANPTRNRPLDLLPLFRWCTEEGMADAAWLGVIEDPDLVKARPTFHYRLPDSRIGHPNWSPAFTWNQWVEIERLAADEPRLDELRAAYLESDPPSWVDRMRRLLAPATGTS